MTGNTAGNKKLGKKLADITQHQLLFRNCAVVSARHYIFSNRISNKL